MKDSKYIKKLRKAKAKARSELNPFQGWSQHSFHKLDFEIEPWKDQVCRIDYRLVTVDEFIERFEKPAIPVVITHGTDHWDASRLWSFNEMKHKYRNEKLKVGEDDDGEPVYLGMKHFMHYCTADAFKEDSPLYVFDSAFGDRLKNNTAKKSKAISDSQPLARLLQDYEIPKYFKDDLFRLVGERRRPPYRWLVMGPARSGTGIHVDPLGTSAWNALLQGRKRWVLFPPGAPTNVIEPRVGDHEASTWFAKVYPTMMQPSPEGGQTVGQSLGMVEIIQNPGETVFVPGGWHHLVMNLDFTIAVTYNFASKVNFEYVWLKTRNSRPRMAEKLLAEIQRCSKSDASYLPLLDIVAKTSTVPRLPYSSSSSSSSSSDSSDDDSNRKSKKRICIGN